MAGLAADELAAAAGHVLRCTEKHAELAAAWKLLGDVLLLQHAVDPARELRVARGVWQAALCLLHEALGLQLGLRLTPAPFTLCLQRTMSC